MSYDSVISPTTGRYSAIIVQRGPLSRLPVCSPEHQVPSEKGLILYKSVRFFFCFFFFFCAYQTLSEHGFIYFNMVQF